MENWAVLGHWLTRLFTGRCTGHATNLDSRRPQACQDVVTHDLLRSLETLATAGRLPISDDSSPTMNEPNWQEIKVPSHLSQQATSRSQIFGAAEARHMSGTGSPWAMSHDGRQCLLNYKLSAGLDTLLPSSVAKAPDPTATQAASREPRCLRRIPHLSLEPCEVLPHLHSQCPKPLKLCASWNPEVPNREPRTRFKHAAAMFAASQLVQENEQRHQGGAANITYGSGTFGLTPTEQP